MCFLALVTLLCVGIHQSRQLWLVQQDMAAGSFPGAMWPEEGSNMQLSESGGWPHNLMAAHHQCELTRVVSEAVKERACLGDSSQDCTAY